MVVVVVGRVDDLFPGVSLFFFTGAILTPSVIEFPYVPAYCGSDPISLKPFPCLAENSLFCHVAPRGKESLSPNIISREISLSVCCVG